MKFGYLAIFVNANTWVPESPGRLSASIAILAEWKRRVLTAEG